MSNDLAVKARKLADNLRADIDNTSTRSEYIRMIQLATEADILASALEAVARITDEPTPTAFPPMLDFPTH